MAAAEEVLREVRDLPADRCLPDIAVVEGVDAAGDLAGVQIVVARLDAGLTCLERIAVVLAVEARIPRLDHRLACGHGRPGQVRRGIVTVLQNERRGGREAPSARAGMS